MKGMRAFVLGFVMVAFAGSLFADTTIKDIMPALKSVKAEVSSALNAIDKDLADAAKKLSTIDLRGEEAIKIMAGICKDRPYAADCSIIGAGTDIKTPLMSKVIQSPDGTNKIDIEYPIINDKGEFLGVVSLLMNHDEFLGGILVPITENKPCKAWVMQPDGVILYDQDPDQVNKNIFTDPMFSDFKDLISFSRTVAASSTGGGSYDFYKEGMKDTTVVKKDAAWDTVGLYGAQWRIVVMALE